MVRWLRLWDVTVKQILIADDHEVVRTGLRAIVETRADWIVCAEAADGKQCLELASKLKPDVAIVDYSMPVMNGFDAARATRRSVPGVKLLFLTTYSSPTYADEAFKSGADGYLVKHAALSELPLAISAVLEGRQYRSPLIGQQSGTV